MSRKTANEKESIYITRQMALSLGTKFYISENACRNCGSRPSLRYTANSCCINCNRKRYQKKEAK